MIITYTRAEQFLLDQDSYLYEVNSYEFERLAEAIIDLDYEEIGYSVELSRCPSTDIRIYILHWTTDRSYYMCRYQEFEWLKPKDLQHLKEK